MARNRTKEKRVCMVDKCMETFEVYHHSNRGYCDDHKYLIYKNRGCNKQGIQGRYINSEDRRNFMIAKKQQQLIKGAWG